MKTTNFLFILLLPVLCCSNSNQDKEEYPIVTELGKQTCIGKIILVRDPFCISPDIICPPGGGKVFGLETVSGNYVLSFNSQLFTNILFVENSVYLIDDEVEITGIVSVIQITPTISYNELVIEDIKQRSERNTYIGKITGMWNPLCLPPLPPCLPNESSVFGLRIFSENYILDFALTFGSHLFKDKLIIEDIEYFVDDEVEITGLLNGKQDALSRKYTELEIETIKKSTLSNIETLSLSNSKVYFDATKQAIVIDATLQNQPLTFELINMQGKVVCSKTSLGNSSIGVANLPKGIYLYRLLQNNGAVHSGKLMLK